MTAKRFLNEHRPTRAFLQLRNTSRKGATG
jgi:hypothetical protein